MLITRIISSLWANDLQNFILKMKSYQGPWKAKLDKKWGKSVSNLYSWVESSWRACMVPHQSGRRRNRAQELEAGRTFFILQDLVVLAWHQRNRESCSGTQFPAGAQTWAQPSRHLGWDTADPQHPGAAENRTADTQLPAMTLVSDLPFLASPSLTSS